MVAVRPLRVAPVPVLVAALLAGCLASGPGEAHSWDDATGLILHGAPVWTGDDAMPWAGAVAIVADRITAVGADLSDVQGAAGERPFIVRLAGGMVMPGFHDTHSHFVRSMLNDEPGGVNPYEPWPPGWDPVMGTIEQQVVAAGHIGTWAGNNAERVQDGALPEPPHHSIAALHEDPAHQGAEDHWTLDGRLAANDLAFADGSWKAPADVPPMMDLGQATAARFGLTSHVEAGVPLATLDTMARFSESGELTARYNLYVFPEDLDAAIAQGLATGSGTDDARLLGLKIYADGWLGPRTSALRDLYNDRPHQGFIFFSQEEVDDYVLRAHQAGLKLTAHAIGDRAVDRLLTGYERAMAEPCGGHPVCLDARWTLEHVQLVQPDLLDRMVSLGVVPSIQLSFATSDAYWAEMALGAERLQHAYPWQTFVDAGLTVGGSSDWPIEVLPPLWGIERVVTRQEIDDRLPAPFMPEQALDLDTALRLVTVNAAYLEFREHELGTVTPGKFADLVVLSEDLFSIAPTQIAETEVLLTMLGGRPVHATGELAEAFGAVTP